MNQLTNKEIRMNSVEVSEMVEKEHSKLLRDIRTYIGYLNEAKIGHVEYFIESTYTDIKGEERPCYLITKMGCEMIANKLTGAKGVVFTAKYVKKFNEMEKGLSLKLPQTYKEALLALVAAEEEKEKLQLAVDHKQEVINGLTQDVTITTKKDIINRVVKWKGSDFQLRYRELYRCFKETHHIDLQARREGYNLKQPKIKDKLSVIQYAEKFGHINELYGIACSLYESDVNDIKKILNLIS